MQLSLNIYVQDESHTLTAWYHAGSCRHESAGGETKLCLTLQWGHVMKRAPTLLSIAPQESIQCILKDWIFIAL